MSAAVLLFLARILLLLLLYLFLYVVVRSLWRDLRTVTAQPAAAPLAPPYTAAPSGLGLELVATGQASLSPGARFPLRDPLVIGRSAASDITLEDDWISAQHLRLRCWNGAWVAEDMGSTNGTRVNGTRVNGAVRVGPGDVLELGRVKFKLVDGL